MFDKLEELEKKLAQLQEELMSPDVVNDQNRFKRLMKEQSDITPIVEKYQEYNSQLLFKDKQNSLQERIDALNMLEI